MSEVFCECVSGVGTQGVEFFADSPARHSAGLWEVAGAGEKRTDHLSFPEYLKYSALSGHSGYSDFSRCAPGHRRATGLVISNTVRLIAESLDGTSGFVLSLMSRAMDRSFASVLFDAAGRAKTRAQAVRKERTVMRSTLLLPMCWRTLSDNYVFPAPAWRWFRLSTLSRNRPLC
jgi:hypothetical protein